jgi:hypothetical protein
VSVIMIGMVMIGMVMVFGGVIGSPVAIVIMGFACFMIVVGVIVIFRRVIGSAIAVMVMVGLALGRMIVILGGMVRGAVAIVIVVRRFFGRVVFRGVVGNAIAVVVVRHARFLLGAEHHFADFQHRLGAVRLLFHQQGGAVLGDHGGVESRLAAAADA